MDFLGSTVLSLTRFYTSKLWPISRKFIRMATCMKSMAFDYETPISRFFRIRIVHPRETRITGIATHALLGISLLMLPKPLQFLPVPVLYGVFLYVAFTALPGNQFYERILLLLTEQANYPPTSYPSPYLFWKVDF